MMTPSAAAPTYTHACETGGSEEGRLRISSNS